MLDQILFLRALLAHLDPLQALLGEQWPELRARLLVLLYQLASEANEQALPARVNRIFRCFEGTLAEPLVQALFQQAADQAQHHVGSVSMERRSVELRSGGVTHNRDDRELAGNADELLEAARELAQSAKEEIAAEPETRAEKRINVWISERVAEPARPLALGERYTLNLGVGKAVDTSLIGGEDATVPQQDVAGGGLQTEWIVTSSAFELASDDPNVAVSAVPKLWTGRFSMLIPEQDESEVRRLSIVPRLRESHQLQVLIFAIRASRSELYRQFTIDVPVEAGAGAPTTVCDEIVYAPSAHMNLGTTHEWTTPPARLTVSIVPGMLKAIVYGDPPGRSIQGEDVDWYAQQANLAGPILNVREATEKFRGKAEKYLNDIDARDLLRRFEQFAPTYDWASWKSRADPSHAGSWDQTSTSQELRELAIYGHDLYETVFPPGAQLRTWMELLPPGSRVDFSWTESSGPGYVPNVPWGLMYLPDPPAPGRAVDPMGFLALRFRLGYRGYRGVSSGPSKALGAMAEVHQAYCLYWGSHPNDETGNEASWQRQQFQGWQNRILVPQTPGSPSARAEVLQALSAPPRSPTPVLYFFCQAAAGDGNKPALRFGPTSGPADVLQTTDLLGKPLEDQPLVFANACTTSAADPYVANLLQQTLFRRGCRGFLGTETKVPIQLASRFATIFFNFFYRKIDPAPMAAGEALAQARLFLLTEYANLGGIFYAYLNQYELFMANDAEVAALRAA